MRHNTLPVVCASCGISCLSLAFLFMFVTAVVSAAAMPVGNSDNTTVVIDSAAIKRHRRSHFKWDACIGVFVNLSVGSWRFCICFQCCQHFIKYFVFRWFSPEPAHEARVRLDTGFFSFYAVNVMLYIHGRVVCFCYVVVYTAILVSFVSVFFYVLGHPPSLRSYGFRRQGDCRPGGCTHAGLCNFSLYSNLCFWSRRMKSTT